MVNRLNSVQKGTYLSQNQKWKQMKYIVTQNSNRPVTNSFMPRQHSSVQLVHKEMEKGRHILAVTHWLCRPYVKEEFVLQSACPFNSIAHEIVLENVWALTRLARFCIIVVCIYGCDVVNY